MPELHLDGQVEAFFDTFAAASDQLDTDRLAELFADPFLAADPAGAQAVPREAFLHTLPRRAQLVAAAGIARVVLTGLQHHALDDTYILARTDWRGERTTASAPVRLSSTFILRRDADRLRVVFYLNHQDLTRVLSVA
jgi:ketosteroid isomerase-like protein